MATIQQPEKEDEHLRFKKATDYVDKLIVLFPTYDKFSISNLIATYRVKNDNDIGKYQEEIIKLLLEEFQYIDRSGNRNNNCSLTNIGRKVKDSGGHYKYLGLLEKQELAELKDLAENQEKENQIREETLTLTKLNIEQARFERKFGRKYKKIGIIISIITIISTLFFNILLYKPNHEPNRNGDENKIDSLNILITNLESRLKILEEKQRKDTLSKR